MTTRTLHPARILGLLAALAVCLLLASGAATAQGTPAGTYTNPVSKGFADTFADPAVIKAKDGYWYSYGTTDPLREGERRFHTIPISRSKDLVNWTFVGDAFDSPSEVSWADTDAALWAPDIRYLDGKYYMYYVVTQTSGVTTPEGRNDNAIGVATAPTPTGPWTDSGAPVVRPRPGDSGRSDDYKWTFDPNEFTDSDGKKYLYYGSYYGGIFVTELSPDGKRAVGAPTMVAIDNRYEGAYVVHRDGYYYLFGSSANCCAGPTTGYSVYVGRSKSPRGPFLDKEGQSMTESRVGGSIVVTPNGNKWIGPGHNAVVTDLAGEDFFVYHALDRADPYLDEPFGINERPMLIDRLDWINGWPTVRGGRWASESAERAPVIDGPVNDSFNRRTSLGRTWRSDGGAWRIVKTRDGKGYVRQQSRPDHKTFLVKRAGVPKDVRAEADLRLTGGRAAGVVVRYKDETNYAAAWLDRRRDALITEVVTRGRSSRDATPLPANFDFGDWHNVAVEVRGREMFAEVTDARLHDPLATAEHRLPARLDDGKVGVAARGRAGTDNVSAARLYRPNTDPAPTPEAGTLSGQHSDEFNDTALEPEWEWIRTPDGQESGGAYRWPVQSADIVGEGAANNASLLLRDAPQGEYIVETKLTIDLGTDTIRNFQQGGIIAYLNDDHWARLSHVAIWNTRQTEFGKEMPFAGRTSFGGMLIGPPSDTTWLRLAHRVDPANGEHEYRAGTSRDGENYVWGGVWTLPAGEDPRIGLLSLGKQGSDPSATSEFDYFRVYRP